jgi:hypothetical protein
MKVQNPVRRSHGFKGKPEAGHHTPHHKAPANQPLLTSHGTTRRASRPRSPLQSRSYEPESLKVRRRSIASATEACKNHPKFGLRHEFLAYHVETKLP